MAGEVTKRWKAAEETIRAMAKYDQRLIKKAPNARHAIDQWLKNAKQQVRDCVDDSEPYGRDVIAAVRELGQEFSEWTYATAWKELK